MAKAKAASADAKLNAQAERLTDLAAEVADLRGQVARLSLDRERLRERVIAVAAGHVVVCRQCASDAELSVTEQSLRDRLRDQDAEVRQLRALVAAGGVAQTG
jgi:hypothetical protein